MEKEQRKPKESEEAHEVHRKELEKLKDEITVLKISIGAKDERIDELSSKVL